MLKPDAGAHELQQRRLEVAARTPEQLIGDALDAVAPLLLRQTPRPGGIDVVVEQRFHLRGQEG